MNFGVKYYAINSKETMIILALTNRRIFTDVGLNLKINE